VPPVGLGLQGAPRVVPALDRGLTPAGGLRLALHPLQTQRGGDLYDDKR